MTDQTGPESPDDPSAAPPALPPSIIESRQDLVASVDDKKKKKGALGFFRELPVLFLIAFALALLIKTFLLQAFFIPSESMLPTLEVGDRVLVNKIVYRLRDPRRGEIIVFVGERDKDERSFGQRLREFFTEGFGVSAPGEKDFIKRVIGLPGETVEVTERGEVFITPVRGKRFKLDEPYISDEIDEAAFDAFVVPRDMYFVMGDNRPHSADSRSALGPIRKGDILGRAFVRLWPPSRLGVLRRPSYETAAAAAIPAVSVALLGASPLRSRRR